MIFMQTACRKRQKLATRLQKNTIHRLLQPSCSDDFLPLQRETRKNKRIWHTIIITTITMNIIITTTTVITIIIMSCPPT
jgi:hypothetical protein